jgi:nucleoside-diphosphate-sugar epimerase
MILFTGSGALAEEFSKMYQCEVISARNMDDTELISWILKSKVIIHNAAIINTNDFQEFIDSNFLLTKRILDLVFKINPKIKFINISSMSILENQDDYMAPDLMTNYAFSKYIAELYCVKHPFEDIVNVRFSTIFYGDEKRDGISKLVYDSLIKNEITIYNDGEAKRDIIPIRIASMYLFKLCCSKISERKINIVSGNSFSFKYIVLVLKKNNKTLKINNIYNDSKKVLSSFSRNSIENLGEIYFSIEDEIGSYLDKIK